MTKRRAYAISAIITTALLAAVSLLYGHAWLRLPELPTITPGYYAVTKVVDGDTIEVNMNGQTEKIRMIGIDTPETKKPNAPVQCFGPEASEFAAQTLSGKSVRLEADSLSDNRDRYDRLLRYVYLQDGSFFEELMISKGYAFAYVSFPFSKEVQLSKLQEEARASNVGLWGACQPKQTGNRWQSNDITP